MTENILIIGQATMCLMSVWTLFSSGQLVPAVCGFWWSRLEGRSQLRVHPGNTALRFSASWNSSPCCDTVRHMHISHMFYCIWKCSFIHVKKKTNFRSHARYSQPVYTMSSWWPQCLYCGRRISAGNPEVGEGN